MSKPKFKVNQTVSFNTYKGENLVDIAERTQWKNSN